MTYSTIRVTHLHEVDHRRPTYVAIGSFDGVHRGHQAMLQTMVERARENGVRTAALTFFPHPRRVLQTLPPRFYISTLDERVHLLAEQGIDVIITHPFDDEVRRIRAAHFVDQLIETLDMRQLWGGNFALGYRREGDIPFLQAQGQTKGFTVELVDAMVEWDNQLVSSRRIRAALEVGNIEEVNGCLGRRYSVRGPIIKGDQRGPDHRLPTANLALWDELILPANGVYATYAWLGDQRYTAATNVGIRPTVNGSDIRVEAHLLDFDRDIYGEELELEFIRRIRDEMKFAGLDALKAQIAADVDEIRRISAELDTD